MVKTLTNEEIGKIAAFKQENYSNREIANKIGRDHICLSILCSYISSY